jgi:hypothetical protein
MRKWLRSLGVVALLAAVLGAGSTAANANGRTDRKDVTVSLYATVDTSYDNDFAPANPALPPPGENDLPKVGDRFFFRDILYHNQSATNPGPVDGPIGDNIGGCTVVHVVEPDAVHAVEPDAQIQCLGTITITGLGALSWQGTFKFGDFIDPGFITVAITGGTGEFFDAGGEIRVSQPNPEAQDTPSVYEVHLLHLGKPDSSHDSGHTHGELE